MPAQSLPVIDSRCCTGCEDCVDCCPVDCLRLMRHTEIVVVPHACVSCGVCARVCPVGAIAMQTLDW